MSSAPMFIPAVFVSVFGAGLAILLFDGSDAILSLGVFIAALAAGFYQNGK